MDVVTRRRAATAVVAAWMALPGLAIAKEGTPRTDPQNRTLTILAESSIQTPPEIAEFSLQFTAYGWTVAKSGRKVDQLIKEFQEKLAKEKIQPASLQIGQTRLKPSYQFNRDLKANVPSDFLMTRSVTLRLEDFSQIAGLLDASIAVGSFLVGSARLTVKDPAELKRKAFQAALEEARLRAKTAALSANAEAGEIMSVEELDSSVMDVNLIEDVESAAMAASHLKDVGAGSTEESVGGSAKPADSESSDVFSSGQVRAHSRLRVTFALR